MRARWYDDTGWAAEIVDGWYGEAILARRWYASHHGAGRWLADVLLQLARRQVDEVDGFGVEPLPPLRATVVAHPWPRRQLDPASLLRRALVIGPPSFTMDADRDDNALAGSVPFAPPPGEHHLHALWYMNRVGRIRSPSLRIDVAVTPTIVHLAARVQRAPEPLHDAHLLARAERWWVDSPTRHPRPT